MTLNEKLLNHALILGSASPRRRDLISHLGLEFTIRTANIDEHAPDGYDGFETAMHLAKDKAAALKPNLHEGEILITADTEVWQNNTRFGKPENIDDARRMLNLLIGNQHQVISGVCLTTTRAQHCFTVATDVHMRTLRDDEIDYYLKNGHPLDKAGAYGIQEWIGLVAIERIDGSYTNVVGLPMTEFYTELEQFIDSISKSQ